MTKTNEELNKLKEEYIALKNKLKELSQDELNTIFGGAQEDGREEHAFSWGNDGPQIYDPSGLVTTNKESKEK